MNKKFGLFLVAIFLVTQGFSLFHVAKNGFAKHEHNGKVCEIYLGYKQSQNLDVATADFIADFQYVISPKQTDQLTFSLADKLNISFPRAPPFLS